MRLADLARRAKDLVGRIVSRPRSQQHVPWTKPPVVRPPAPPIVRPAVPPVVRPPSPPTVHPHSAFPAIPPTRTVADIAALQRLVHDAVSGQAGMPADSIQKIADQVRRIRDGGNLTPQQSSIISTMEDLIGRWDSPPKKPDEDWPETDIQPLGRADVPHWPRDMREFRTEQEMRRTPGSSNVYSFTWMEDSPRVAYGQRATTMQRSSPNDMGTLVVTFKDWMPGADDRPDAPGATYAYSMVPRAKWEMFVASTSPETAGVAVWDYLRVRGTISGHQHNYRLLSVSGEYIPRKATAAGFATRFLPGGVDDQWAWRKSTMEAGPLTRFGKPVSGERPLAPSQWRRALPDVNPGLPNRGSPNRGSPNRGT